MLGKMGFWDGIGDRIKKAVNPEFMGIDGRVMRYKLNALLNVGDGKGRVICPVYFIEGAVTEHKVYYSPEPEKEQDIRGKTINGKLKRGSIQTTSIGDIEEMVS